MRKRVRKTQRLWITDAIGALREIVIKHDAVRPVAMPTEARLAAYVAQNGSPRLTPRQAKRLRLKGSRTARAGALPVADREAVA